MSSITYYSYLLRLWLVNKDEGREWRASLENVETGEKHGFARMDDLVNYLNQVLSKIDETNGKGS